MKTFASLCTGGGIYEQGLSIHNIEPIWGVEIDRSVAEVYKLNYPDSKIVVNDVCNVDFASLPRPDYLHASPSCRNFSLANNKSETVKDVEVAHAIALALNHFKPEVFTLENVAKYQDSQSWKIILEELTRLGFKVSFDVQKLHRWGIPQKRRYRFIAIATLDRPAIRLIPTNRTKYWYEEIQDLIPELQPSSLTNTQKKKLTLKTEGAISKGETVLLKRNQIRNSTPCAYSTEAACWTITATLCTDHNQGNRSLFADLITQSGIFKLNTRCLARIQTIPDSYKLSGNIAIDGLVIGDGVPSYFVEQMWEQILKQLLASSF